MNYATAISTRRTFRTSHRRGAAALLAMLFLVLLTTLTVAMFGLASTNVETASNLSDVSRAQTTAESGLRWMSYRFNHMSRPKTTTGLITATVANTLWPALKTSIVNDLNTMLLSSERATTTTTTSLTTSSIKIDDTGATFKILVQQHPLNVSDTLDQRFLRVTSTGTYRGAKRTVSMDYQIDKKVKFAVVGKVPIQLGRNTLIDGPVGMATASKYPPLFMLSDFTSFDNALKTKITNWETWLKTHHSGYDGRVSVNNTTEYNAAKAAGYTDYNADGYADEFDIFMKQYDTNGDKKVTKAEFTNPSTGKLYEDNLFASIDSLNGPMFSGDPPRTGFQDNVIDNSDGYEKIRGQVAMATSASGWTSNLAGSGQTINDQIVGPVAPSEADEAAIKFSATSTDIFDLTPANFETCCNNYKAMSGPAAGATSKTATAIKNYVLTAADANATAVTEKTPFGSTTYQATFKRPVFKNITFTNVQIPKGLNAMFDGCTFKGVTFVDMQHDITNTGGAVTTDPNDGRTWAQTKVSGTGTWTKDSILLSTGSPAAGQMITKGSQIGNNIRFNNCTFNGPVVGGYSTAYTHFANSWEFTGATLFNNQVDSTATIVCPNTNIEMGSFTDPNAAPSTLVGVVVAGNLDIRGTSSVDGSIIITGDGAGNTTLGYFGPDDAATTPSAMPEGGFGRLNIRYNPTRAMPDGINVAIDVLPNIDSYQEGQ